MPNQNLVSEVCPQGGGASGILEGLNSPQAEAVCLPLDTHGAILAGAGTGKTRVLVHRIAWLVQQGVPPSRILAVTFTNKASKEMRERVTGLIGEESAKTLRLGTFHSIGLRILRRYGAVIGLHNAAHLAPMDQDESVALLRRVMKERQCDLTIEKPKDHFQLIQHWKDRGLTPEKVPQQNNASDELTRHLYARYESEKQRSQAVDFGDLILMPNIIFAARPEIAEKVQRGLSQVLVDEFQDTNAEQNRFIGFVTGNGGAVKTFVVGDDDQSIYGWRGAEASIMQRFIDRYQPNHLVRLEENYRCNPVVLEAANAVIAHNKARIGKNLWTQRVDAHPVSLRMYGDGDDEADAVAEEIADRLAHKVPAQDIAVLYRKNMLSRGLERALVQLGVPYRVYGGLTFYQRKEIKDALAYLRLVANPHDDGAFRRAVATPRRGIGDKKLSQLTEQCRRNESSLWTEAALEVKGKLPAFMDEISRLTAAYRADGLGAVTRAVVVKTGLRDFYIETAKERGEECAENLNELVRAVDVFHHRFRTGQTAVASVAAQPGDVLSEFLTEAVLESDAGGKNTNRSDVVSLMTVHKAKGLEFGYVFVIGLEDGEFPKLSSNGHGDIEEERRLFYVALTRSKHALYLSYAAHRQRFGMRDEADDDMQEDGQALFGRSRFVSEIPPHLLLDPLLVDGDAAARFPAPHRSRLLTYNENSDDIW
jgi:DNA helicase-2/ATP-dependent DNA helicase PcrA